MELKYEVVTEDDKLILPPQSATAYRNWLDQEGGNYEFLAELRSGHLITVIVR